LSTTRRTAGVYSRKRPLGPNGERLCYNCCGLLPKGRRFNCSPACSEEWRGKTSPSHMRYLLFQRDKGICALCRTDTVALRAEYWLIPKELRNLRDAFLAKNGIPYGRASSRGWWDADHITPVVEGGGECGLEGYRTLCIPCHQAETRKLAGRIAEKRAVEKEQKLSLLRKTKPVFGDKASIEARNVLRAATSGRRKKQHWSRC